MGQKHLKWHKERSKLLELEGRFKSGFIIFKVVLNNHGEEHIPLLSNYLATLTTTLKEEN